MNSELINKIIEDLKFNRKGCDFSGLSHLDFDPLKHRDLIALTKVCKYFSSAACDLIDKKVSKAFIKLLSYFYAEGRTKRIINERPEEAIVVHNGDLVIDTELCLNTLIVTGDLQVNKPLGIDKILVVGGSIKFSSNVVLLRSSCTDNYPVPMFVKDNTLIMIGKNATSLQKASLLVPNLGTNINIGGDVNISGSVKSGGSLYAWGKEIKIKGNVSIHNYLQAKDSIVKIGGTLVVEYDVRVKKLKTQRDMLVLRGLSAPVGVYSGGSIEVNSVQTEGDVLAENYINIYSAEYTKIGGRLIEYYKKEGK